uniref:Nanos-type domain-containing protein n=1 Tax=Anopheles minimus TaxID=112268 RepID=A0A182WHT7_9DIPT
MEESECGETERRDNVDKILAVEGAAKFLQKYPELREFVLNKSSYRFDIHTLIVEAALLSLKPVAEDIQSEFEANGTSSELCEDDESLPEHSQWMSLVGGSGLNVFTADKATKTDEPTNESSECDVFQDITNQSKETCRIRRNRRRTISHMQHCVFCLNNGADKEFYESHSCKDERGNVTCPVLREFVCKLCSATGTNAHTAKYCPLKPIITLQDCLAMEQKWHQQRHRRSGEKSKRMYEQNKPSVGTQSRSRLRF